MHKINVRKKKHHNRITVDQNIDEQRDRWQQFEIKSDYYQNRDANKFK